MVRADLAALAVEDEPVSTVPVLDHVQPVVNLAAQGLEVQIATQEDRLDGLAQLAVARQLDLPLTRTRVAA